MYSRGIKALAKAEGRRISGKAIKKIADKSEAYISAMLKKAERNAAYSGRVTIKEQDIEG